MVLHYYVSTMHKQRKTRMYYISFKRLTLTGMLISILFSLSVSIAEEEGEPLFDMSLSELLKVEVTTASRAKESIKDAPAVVIVLTQADLIHRGYGDLSQIFDDLPGMDVSRAYGDAYFKNSWRGLRKTIGSAYLLMVDGITFNHLYYSEAEILAAIPMSNIERVEVVYGPASVAYGANAFTGVINIITQKQEDLSGNHQKGFIRIGSFNTRQLDTSYFYRQNDFNFQFTYRQDRGVLDDSYVNEYEWSSQQYYANEDLWGDFLQLSKYGKNQSSHKHKAIDVRMGYKNQNIVYQEFELNNGYGNEYPADLAQNNASWREPEKSIYWQGHFELSENLRSNGFIRYRESDIDPRSDFLEGYNVVNSDNGLLTRVLDYSYWSIQSESYSWHQDFLYNFNESITMYSGIKYEKKYIQPVTNAQFGPSLPVDEVDIDTYPFPSLPLRSDIEEEDIEAEDKGIYVLSKYVLYDDPDKSQHAIHLGVRVDNNSHYGTTQIYRGGYVWGNSSWTLKALYGESFQEPPPRLLYSGWSGSGFNTDLIPEKGETLEFNASYQNNDFHSLLSIYRLKVDDSLSNFAGGASNFGERQVVGLDWHINWEGKAFYDTSISLWGYYSYIDAKETGADLNQVAIGDISPHKIYIGGRAQMSDNLYLTLRARSIYKRNTVATNPVDHVGSYTLLDMSFVYRDVIPERLHLALNIDNVFNRAYFHPGIRQADAGIQPGYFNNSNEWVGSAGFYNSLLPQPGRAVYLTFHYSW